MITAMILTIIFFILLQAFFSGSEIAVISVNRIKMEQLTKKKVPQAMLLKKMLASADRLLSTTLVGTNLSVVISSAICTVLIMGSLGARYSWLTAVIMTPVILIFGEAVPKATFRYYANTISFKIAGLLQFFGLLFWPIVILVTTFSRIILFPLRLKDAPRKSLFVTREELKWLIKESQQNGAIKPHERATIHRIFEFGTKKVNEIMVPLKDAVSIDAQEGLGQLKELAAQSGFSRILIYEGRKENIIGFANVFDALYEEGKFTKAADCLRPVLYISQQSPIDEVFYSLQLKRMQIAILLDEDKKHAGMVTFKDLLDEIVGEM